MEGPAWTPQDTFAARQAAAVSDRPAVDCILADVYPNGAVVRANPALNAAGPFWDDHPCGQDLLFFIRWFKELG